MKCYSCGIYSECPRCDGWTEVKTSDGTIYFCEYCQSFDEEIVSGEENN